MEVIFEFSKHAFVKIKGKYFWSRQVSPDSNICDCMNCHKLIGDEVPMRFWPYEGQKGELAFCGACAKELGLLG